MLDCRQLDGWRIIADPDALDATAWAPDHRVVRISPDDVFVIGGDEPVVADPHAIITPEHGFLGADLTAAEVTHLDEHHIEWSLPSVRPTLSQGQVAGVPAKLVLDADGSALLLVAAATSRDLIERLS